jgi:hypothetical protein
MPILCVFQVANYSLLSINSGAMGLGGTISVPQISRYPEL